MRDYHGESGSGCLILCRSTNRVLLTMRSDLVEEPRTWSTIGGALEPDLSPRDNALKEIEEEVDFYGNIQLMKVSKYVDDSFVYHNYIGFVLREFEPICNWECSQAKWMTLDEMLEIRDQWHFGLEYLYEQEKDLIHDLLGPS